MSAVEQPVTTGELVALFTGVEHEDGGWTTTPCYTVPLATLIAQQLQPVSEHALRHALYGQRDPADIDQKAIYVLELAYQRHKQTHTPRSVRQAWPARNRGL